MRSRRALLATLVALSVSTVGGVDAAGRTKVTTTPKLPATLDAVTPVIMAKVNLGQKFSALESLCVTLYFEDDLLDPGEAVAVEFVAGVGGGPPGTPSQAVRTVCQIVPSSLEVWLDGKQTLGIYADAGTSVIISALEFEAVGTPRILIR